jgi:hypothetical protein
LARKISPPIKPKVRDKFDVAYFDDNFTKEDPRHSFTGNEHLEDLEKYNEEFDDFYFE